MKIENLDVEVGQSVRVYMAGHKFKAGKKKKGKPLYFKGTVKVYGKSKHDKRFKDGFVILYGMFWHSNTPRPKMQNKKIAIDQVSRIMKNN